MKRVLITGGAGFIGRWVAQEGLSRGWQIVVYDNFSVGTQDNLKQLDNIIVYEDDIRNSEKLAHILSVHRIDIVYHLAAIHYIPHCERNPLEAMSINVQGTLSIAEAMHQAKISRLVFASTGALYPPVNMPLSEETPVKAQDIYGLTKLQGEQIVDYYHQRYGLQVTIARLFNTYGPFETNPHLLPHIIQTLKQGERVLHLGNLHPKRDYIYVEDVAEALCRLGTLEEPFGIYNIGYGEEYSVLEVVKLLSNILGKIEIVQDPDRMRAVDKPHQCADISRLSKRLKWRPQISLQEGLMRWLRLEGIIA
ncbi:MAG: NAD-dependent epimerase [Armatimonadota bacterium]